MQLEHQKALTPTEIFPILLEKKSKHLWEEIASYLSCLPTKIENEWIKIAEEIAFSLSQLQRVDEASSLFEEIYKIEPNHRRASALAYIYYVALINKGKNKDKNFYLKREEYRKKFIKWINEALAKKPDSIKDLYRLGTFESRIHNNHDKVALQAFEKAIASFKSLPEAEKEKRGDLLKTYIKCLYSAARSACKIKLYLKAYKLIFLCIKEDEKSNFIEPVHKYYLAAKVLQSLSKFQEAERFYKMALEAKSSMPKDYIFYAMAEICMETGRVQEALGWIEKHIEPQKRNSAVWRLVGDIRIKMGDTKAAVDAYENSLLSDRVGRHLTLVRIGKIYLNEGKLKRAEKAFWEANKFRRKKYLSSEPSALMGLIKVAEAKGEIEKAEELKNELKKIENNKKYRKNTQGKNINGLHEF